VKAIILAGGLGTRLRAVADDRPKVMVDIGGRPFLEYQLDHLRAQGFTDLVLCLGYGAQLVQEYFGAGERHGVRIAYVVERKPLGTAGALRNAAPLLDATFLVLNGDTYLEADFAGLVEFQRRRRLEDPNTLGSLAAVVTSDAVASGALDLDQWGYIRSFKEKAERGGGWINAGVYALETAVLDLIPEGESVSIEMQTFPKILARGKRLLGYRVEGRMIDIGTPAGYVDFGNYIRSGHGPDAGSPSRSAG
jgi:NDP-sugar pyrophosphorylase family protein